MITLAPSLRRVAALVVLALATGCSGGGDGDDDDGPTVPAINSVTPTSAIVGSEVTITGARFGDEQDTSSVTFDGITASVTSWSDTEIVAVVPPDAYPGTRPVEVTVDGETSSPFAFTVVLPDAVYANNATTPTSVTAFTTSSGAFTATYYVVGTGGSSNYGGDSSAIYVHPGTRRVFSTHRGLIGVFDIDPVTGLLTEVAGSPFDTGLNRLFGVEVSDAGDVVYAAECGSDDAVAAMAVDAGGALAHLPGSPTVYPGVTTCVDVVRLTPDDQFLVAAVEDGTVRVYSVGTIGALTEVAGSPFTVVNEGSDNGFEMHPFRNAFYLPSTLDEGLYAYSITTGTGVPVLLNGVVQTGQSALSGFAFSEDGNRLFALNAGDDQMFVYGVDGTGALTLGSAYTLAAAANPIEVDGTTLWAGGVDGMLYRYTLSTNGEPTASGTPVPNPLSSSAINAIAVP